MLLGPLSLTARCLAEEPVTTTCVHAPPTTCTPAIQPMMEDATRREVGSKERLRCCCATPTLAAERDSVLRSTDLNLHINLPQESHDRAVELG